ncbi:MAG: hypothetical protein ABSA40_10290 [Candidatus Dormibacteria bacterium]
MTGGGRRRLLLLLAPADHPHRDLVCATLAWVAAAEGSLFECYYDARPSGSHFGGGLPPGSDPNEMRGGTLTGAHHLEQLLLVLQRFDCEAASLGPAVLGDVIDSAGVAFRSRSPDVALFYEEVLASSRAPRPDTLLVVGEGRTPGTGLTPFAFPEIVNRRLLAIADGDPETLARLRRGRTVESLWPAGPPPDGATVLRPEQTASAAEETAWMAERWSERGRGFILGDPELVGRWIPTAAREGWMPIHGTPQTDVIDRLAEPLRRTEVVLGRQHHDNDFLALSRLGVAFQVIDPGRPPFPVLREEPPPWPAPPLPDEPDDAQLSRWAGEGRILSTLLFWTGMARELENLYVLADVLNLTGMAAGLVLTTESFAHMPYPPLTLTQHPLGAGGLAPRVELLLGCAGAGVLMESETPPDRFAATLTRAVDGLAERLGGRDRVPRGWWPLMDAPLVPRPPHRLARHPGPPYFRIRYRAREPEPAATAAEGGGHPSRSPRAVIGRSPLRTLFEADRPFTDFRPGPPGRAVLEAVRDAGFEYAFTASAFGGPPRAVVDVPGMVSLTYTAGRWDGWSPFITVNDLSDLQRAERRLVRSGRPGWLAGTIDTCLWAFTGPVWDRGRDLFALCRWMAGGGSSGRLVNVTPRTAARYARLLADRGLVGRLPSA